MGIGVATCLAVLRPIREYRQDVLHIHDRRLTDGREEQAVKMHKYNREEVGVKRGWSERWCVWGGNGQQ